MAHLWTSSGNVARVSHFHERDREWLAGGGLPVANRRCGKRDVRRLLQRPARAFLADRPYFDQAFDDTPLHAPADRASVGNGLFGTAGTFPTASFQGSNYWVDVLFVLNANDTTAPTINSAIPRDGDDRVPPSAQLKVSFSETMDAGTVTSSTVNPPQFGVDRAVYRLLQCGIELRHSHANASAGRRIELHRHRCGRRRGHHCRQRARQRLRPHVHDRHPRSMSVHLLVEHDNSVECRLGRYRQVRGWCQVPVGYGRLHPRGPVLQERPEHWDTRSASLERVRHAVDVGNLHQRDGDRMATSLVPKSVPDHGQHDVRRLVFRPQLGFVNRPFFNNPLDVAPLHAPSTSASGGNGVYGSPTRSRPTVHRPAITGSTRCSINGIRRLRRSCRSPRLPMHRGSQSRRLLRRHSASRWTPRR